MSETAAVTKKKTRYGAARDRAFAISAITAHFLLGLVNMITAPPNCN